MFITVQVVQGNVVIYSAPSTIAAAKSSGLLPMMRAAFPRIKVKERCCKSCPKEILSSQPWW